jgi:hypothetical protein
MIKFNMDARAAIANIDRIASAAGRIEALQSSVKEAVQPIIATAKSLVQQPGKPGYWKRYGQKKRKKHLRDTIGSTVRIYARALVGVVGPLAPAGAHGHLVEFGHRIATGGSVSRMGTPQIKWRPGKAGRKPKHVFAKGAPSARLRKDGTRRTGLGSVVGQAQAFPFMAQAAEANESQVLGILTKAVARHIDAAAKIGGQP